MDSKWGSSSGYSSHHRQSLRPSGVTASAASRYGLSASSTSSRNGSSSGAAGSSTAAGMGAQLSSSVVSFMRKFVTKASTNSIDSSFQQYQKELQQQQQASSKGSYGSSASASSSAASAMFPSCSSTGASTAGVASSAAMPSHLSHHSDTGYSSNANSPATTPTVSSISASPIPPAQLISSSSFASDGQSGSRPSSAASTAGGSSTASAQTRGPLFSKIRAKMASTFQGTNTPECTAATLTQAAPSVYSAQSSISLHNSTIQRPDSVTSMTSGSTLDAQGGFSSREQRSSSITSTSGAVGGSTSPVSGESSSTQRPPMLSMLSQSHSSSLTNEQLTAHLTEEEKKILEKVFQKEEEFREIALKNFVKNTTMAEGAAGAGSGTGGQPSATMLLTGSPVSGVSHLSANLLDPVAAAVHRRRSSAIMSADASGQCRICRKVIMKDESAHRCSNCQELVCDDCSSYSAREESKYWMCSFCRRRGSHLILTTVATDTTNTSTVSTASMSTSAAPGRERSSALPVPAITGSSTSSSISISVPKSPHPSPPALRSQSTAASASVSIPAPGQPQPSQLLSTASSSFPFTPSSSSSSSSTLQPAVVSKRKSSFSECQMRPHAHEAISSQRQSSLDLQKSAALLQQYQRKSAQFSQSPLLYEQQSQQQAQSWGQSEQQPSKIPRVELPPSQPPIGDSHPVAYYSTATSGASMFPVMAQQDQPTLPSSSPVPSPFIPSQTPPPPSPLLSQPQPSSNITSPSLTTASTTTPTTIALSPQNGNARPRIYSLSDDEELLSDDDDDEDDEDEEFADEDADKEEEEEELFEDDAEEFGKEEFARRMKQQRRVHRKKSLKETVLDDTSPLAEGKKRPALNGKHKARKGVLSPHKDDSYVHLIGGPSHGTLASVPAETLKRRRSSKKKKKKSPHAGQSYNSDDELMMSSAAKQSEDNANMQTGTAFAARRDSGAGLSVPTGNLSTFADVVNTVAANSLMHRASISGYPLPQTASATGFGLQRPLGAPYYGPGKPLAALQLGYKPNQAIASKWWRLSKKVGSLSRSGVHDSSIFGYGSGLRQRKSSESSDLSDVRYSPPQDSLTPSSEYSRSPRESADSEMLGLTYSSLAMQRRSIPSVLVDVGGDSSGLVTGPFLTLKDCYNRRGSAGRALPQIPVEPSRSMLDLPHSRKSSAHSLDIPMEQPRRASAPEGENIRIVIDEVQDVTGSHQELLTSSAGGGIDQDGNYSRSASAGSGRRSSGAIVPQPTVVTQVQVAPQGQTSYQQRMRYQLTRAASIVTHYERIVLHRDENDHSNRTRGFGLAVVGGRLNEQDGMLYAYVSWTKPGGPADKQGLKPGDKILEWCSKSLVNCSYEQVCHVMDICGESAELIVESMTKCDPNQQKRRHSLANQQHAAQPSSTQASQPKIAINPPPPSTSTASSTSSSAVAGSRDIEKINRPSSAAAALVPATSIPPPLPAASLTSSAPPSDRSGGSSASATPRRRLPAIPTTPKSATTAAFLNDAQILLQVTLDANIRQLSVVIVSSRGLDQHPLYQGTLAANMPANEAFAQLRLLPEMGFKVCQTELNVNFEWNETLIYHQFPLERVDEITLDVSVWCTNANSLNPYYPQPPAQLVPPTQIRLRSPRNSAVGLPPQISITSSSEHSSTFQLASTRIPLRSALFVLSEWWPLIPTEVNYVQAPSVVVPPPPLDISNGGSSALSVVPSPAPIPSTAPPVFFHKAPSMDYIDVNSGNLLCDSIMMSRSTPGSRRNSGRSDAGMEMIIEASPCVEEAPADPNASAFAVSTSIPPKRPTTSNSIYRPPTRGSTATLNSSGGRHSLDDSSYSNSMGNGPKSAGEGGSLSLDRTTSLRLVQNRHSVGNLYHLPPVTDPQAAALVASYVRGAHLAAPYQEAYERRKSSSALGQGPSPGGRVVAGAGSGLIEGASVFAGGYSRFLGAGQDDSCQYLLQSQNLGQQISDQDTSPLSSDDDIDNLLLDDSNFNSDQNTPVKPTNTFPNYRPQSSASVLDGSGAITQAELQSQPAKKLSDPKLNQLTVIDSNKLSIASIDDPSRYSGTASPVTPSNEEEPEEASGSVGSQQNLLAPNWATGRRRSFLQRLIPTGVAAGASMLLNRADESLAAEQAKSVVVGEIKLGFVMTKGFLEIEVIAARGLPNSIMGHFPPDTYVKTYVYDKGRQLHKRKTRVVPSDNNPSYRQTLKYDANFLYDRSLLISVWEKQKRTFDSNVPVGATEINVNQLELHKLTIRWYRLRSFVSGIRSAVAGDTVAPEEPTETEPSTSGTSGTATG